MDNPEKLANATMAIAQGIQWLIELGWRPEQVGLYTTLVAHALHVSDERIEAVLTLMRETEEKDKKSFAFWRKLSETMLAPRNMDYDLNPSPGAKQPAKAPGGKKRGKQATIPTEEITDDPGASSRGETLEKRHRKAGTRCSVCEEPQYVTSHGNTCKNGHGGADPLDEDDARKKAAARHTAPSPEESEEDFKARLGDDSKTTLTSADIERAKALHDADPEVVPTKDPEPEDKAVGDAVSMENVPSTLWAALGQCVEIRDYEEGVKVR